MLNVLVFFKIGSTSISRDNKNRPLLIISQPGGAFIQIRASVVKNYFMMVQSKMIFGVIMFNSGTPTSSSTDR